MLFVRLVLLFIVVELFLRMQHQILLGISFGTMSFDLNGILCLLTSKPWRKILRQELPSFIGLKRYFVLSFMNMLYMDVLISFVCSSHFSVVTGNTLLVGEYGNLEKSIML